MATIVAFKEITHENTNEHTHEHINFNNKLSRGEICVANLIPPCEWCKSG